MIADKEVHILSHPHLRAADQPSIQRFLKANPEVAPVVARTMEALGKCFGPNATVAARVRVDPNEGDGELAMLVASPDGWERDLENLAAFDAAYGHEIITDAGGKVTVDVDFT